VGLAQREIESAGITTVALSNIPDLTRAVGVPRLVAIEHPFGETVGRPGDPDRQRAVLWGALEAAEELTKPGGIKQLPFAWPATANKREGHPPTPPPIVNYLRRHPWELPRLLSRDIPRRE